MIFLDNASTTKPYKECLEIYNKYNNDNYFNPSGIYKSAVNVRNDIENARAFILKSLGGTSNDKFIFTSGATESNNIVINTVKRFKKGRFLISLGEHPSVYNASLELKNDGFDVQYIKLNKDGKIDEKDYLDKLNEDVVFVSIIHVNNETGAVNDIAKLVDMAKSVNKNIIFHSDGVQAFGKINVNVKELGVDLYTISAHKIHGIKGVGGLYIKSGILIKPLIFGGGQEYGFRSGTENVGGIISFSKAVEISLKNIDENYKKVANFNKQLCELLTKCNGIKIVSVDCSPYILAFCVVNVRAETLLYMLSDKGVIVGNGSACSSSHRDNRVLKAMGCSSSEMEGALRISFSNDDIDINKVATSLYEVVVEYKNKTGRK